MKLIPGFSISRAKLLAHGLAAKQISAMASNLYLFPTPFKNIYYIPTQDERTGWLIQKPEPALKQALSIHLGANNFYYSCKTAEEHFGIDWHRSGETHVVNPVRSGRIDLGARIGRNRGKKTWRARQVARILEFYGRKIIFHLADGTWIRKAKIKRTPYCDFAMPSQIKKDRKKFREKATE